MNQGLMGAEFLGLSPEELVAKCREYRAEAERLAATANNETRKGYIYLVMQWSILADDIQNAMSQGCTESSADSGAAAGQQQAA